MPNPRWQFVTSLTTAIARRVVRRMPAPVQRIALSVERRLWTLWYRRGSPPAWEDDFPWCSPNIWERVVTFYQARPSPVVFEYGTGISSLHHIRNLLHNSGVYVGVEHEPEWYFAALRHILSYCSRHELAVAGQVMSVLPADVSHPVAPSFESSFAISSRNGSKCFVQLTLRPAQGDTASGDGTLEDFREYVTALHEPCDTMIVDGRARKACINHILDNHLVKPGGMCVLFDACRGMENWMGEPRLTGSAEYQPEVQRMLSLGGELVDGVGLDRWPRLRFRRTMGRTAFSYPLEACFLIVP